MFRFYKGAVAVAGTVDTPCSWTLSVHNATFNTATGAMTCGTLTTGCVTQVTAPTARCTLDFPVQTVEGVSWQNIDASGANSLVVPPWGAKIVNSVSGLTYTATGSCSGVLEHGTMSLSGTLAVHNLFGSL